MTPSIRIALQTLNLTTPCTAKDIKLSYRLLILRYHPDKSRTTATTARFQAVQEAYETLEKAGYLNQQEVNAHDDEPASEEPDPPYRRKPPSAAPPREFKIFTPPTPRNNIWAKHQKAREDRLRAEKGPTRRARGRGGRRFSVFDKSSPLWKTRMRAYAAEEGKEPRKAAEAGDDQRRKADAQPATTASAAAAKRASNESKADKSDRKPHDPPAPTKAKTSPLGATNKHKVGRSRIRNCSRGRSFSLYACSTVFWLCLLPGCRMMFEGLWTGRWDIGLLGLLLCEGNDWLWWAMLRELKGSRVDDEA